MSAVVKQFDDAYQKKVEAARELDSIAKQLIEMMDDPDCDPKLAGKLHRAIDGIRNCPNTFHFTGMNAPNVLLHPAVINSGDGMSGLNWPEGMRHGIITNAQLALIARYSAREKMKELFPQLSKTDQDSRSNLFD